ncbi:aldehyde dehydrogenase family protein [Oceanobacillus halophilus]|uniref:Aldehyde dehydrogenase EutE n=1 Tax=Oceanobacillus halophilus TaxID=930130 RepID=A0A494ZT38_9BACI|nr:aldehyde dehydrogenase family protein [Oceanobacillus halophilus]RKQ29246.1 aldehyde dehydrogenase EutE [Oceanobacillus halophilus]
MELNDLKTLVSKVIHEIDRHEQEVTTTAHGVFLDMNDAIEAADKAQKELVKLTLERRQKIIQAIRNVSRGNAELFSKMAVEESGMGRIDDKIIKNKMAADYTPGIEDLKSDSFTGDNGLTVVELSPYGVIGSITPTTNPTETVICNAIGMIAAGNAVVFSPHPRAKNTSLKAIQLLNEAIVAAGGPANLITTVNDPTIQQADVLMNHKKIRMIVATGGPGLVKAALSTGKKAIGAGAGNPPAVVDETADIEKAAKDIIDGCSFDNNLPCTSEKEVIVVESVADYLIFSMKKQAVYTIEDKQELRKLEELIMVDGKPNREFVGKDAAYILNQIGIQCDKEVRAIIMETDADHPFVQEELMMPVLPIVRVSSFDAAVDLAVEVEHGFRHTAIMHSKNVDHLTKFARAIQTTIFVKNGPSYAGIGAGGEGYSTFTIAGPTGEGLTSAKDFARTRRCVLVDGLFIR